MKFIRLLQMPGLRAAGCLVLFSILGCGGGGGGGGSEPVNYAPGSLNGRTLIVKDPNVGLETSYAFTAGSYTTNADSGTYTYGRTGVLHQATLVSVSQTTSVTATYALTFESPAQGRYKVRKVSSTGSLDEESTFRIQ